MQSHQDSFGSDTLKSRGHRRSETLGKAMPITSLLLNYTPSSLQHSQNIRSDATGPESPTQLERPPLFFSVHDSSPSPEATKISAPENETDDDLDLMDQDYEILISECSSSYGGSHQEDDGDRRKSHSDEYISLIGNSTFYTPCQTCVGSAPSNLAARPSAINEMCRRLCTEECRLRLSLAGLVPTSETIGKNRAELENYVQNAVFSDAPPKLPPRPKREPELLRNRDGKVQPPQMPKRPMPATIAIQRKQFLTDILVQNSNYHEMFSSDDDDDNNEAAAATPKKRPPKELLEIVANIVVPPPTPSVSPLPSGERNTAVSQESPAASKSKGAVARPIVDPHELAMLKDFREKFEIAEALAKTSAMTSTTQIKQRLAARKREIELDNAHAISSADEHEHEHESNESNTNQTDELASTGFGGGTKTGLTPQSQHQRRGVPATDGAVTTAATIAAASASTPAAISSSGSLTQRHPDTGSAAYHDDYEPPRELLLYLVR